MLGDTNTTVVIGFFIVILLQVGKMGRNKYISSAYYVPRIMLIYLFIFINTIESLHCSYDEDIISFLQMRKRSSRKITPLYRGRIASVEPLWGHLTPESIYIFHCCWCYCCCLFESMLFLSSMLLSQVNVISPARNKSVY